MWDLTTNCTLEDLALVVGGSLCDNILEIQRSLTYPQIVIYQLDMVLGILTLRFYSLGLKIALLNILS